MKCDDAVLFNAQRYSIHNIHEYRTSHRSSVATPFPLKMAFNNVII